MTDSNQKNQFAKREEEILKFWQDKKIFEKSLAQRKKSPEFYFYDGPPFATGLPHYGHLVVSLIKDVVLRYQTMKGRYVPRNWGWDCHGLPIENLVEKELKLKTKKDIEKLGIDKFCESCRKRVLDFADEWKKIIPRFGRWVDMENPYKTMDLDYMESIWWVFKNLWDKGLIYQDYKSMHICPRCETTLSQSEVSEGYKDISDISVIAKFELINEPGTFILAWTTTPWTLPGNVALAMGKKINYVKVKSEGKNYILARDNLEKIFEGINYKIIKKITAKELEGKKYKPLFDYYLNKNLKDIYTIQIADFVTVEDGTGVVHIAPGFGEDDMNLGKEKNLPAITHVTSDGRFTTDVKDWSNELVKPKDNHQTIDKKIVDYLEKRGLVFKVEEFSHSYPHCWRCETPLLNYATTSWFVNVTKIKDKALKLAKKINWSPAHIKEGRFGKWLEGAKDWSISRQRYWGSVIPIWQCECGEIRVFGSIKELEEVSGQQITDLHKHFIDKITFKCKCGKMIRRIPDVLDCWFESGSMPYAQFHYPFANKKEFEQSFPADFVAEGVDHTRAWFYYLHIIAAAIKGQLAFRNVIVNGIVLAEDGKKMSKKLNNYPDPVEIMDKYGSDALRYYLLTSPVMEAESINFTEKSVKEAMQKVVMLLENVLSFYQLYAVGNKIEQPTSDNILDKWILAKLHLLIKEVTEELDSYFLPRASRPVQIFIDQLSTWYLRRSRSRFKSNDQQAITTLGYVLQELAKVMAPFTPFIADYIYQQVNGGKESVHLENWPKVDKKIIDKKLLKQMELARQIVEKGLAARAEAKIKIRQPLASLKIKSKISNLKNNEELLNLIKEELNTKEVIFDNNIKKEVELDTKITKRLKLEGLTRELIRQINQLRKEKKLTINDKIIIYYQGETLKNIFSKFEKELKIATLTKEIKEGEISGMKKVEGGKVGIEKIH